MSQPAATGARRVRIFGGKPEPPARRETRAPALDKTLLRRTRAAVFRLTSVSPACPSASSLSLARSYSLRVAMSERISCASRARWKLASASANSAGLAPDSLSGW
eukprot:scaffold8958_cov110-Isochrysis_galbana.AAC.5